MLTVELRVNGAIVSALTVTNKGDRGGGLCEYEFRWMGFPIDNTDPCKSWHGTLNHRRQGGAEVLCKKLFVAMDARVSCYSMGSPC